MPFRRLELAPQTSHHSSAMAVYDVILFGATGFTGGLMLKYLASKNGVKYAICGRNRGKMEQAVDTGMESRARGRRRIKIRILEVSTWNHPRFIPVASFFWGRKCYDLLIIKTGCFLKSCHCPRIIPFFRMFIPCIAHGFPSHEFLGTLWIETVTPPVFFFHTKNDQSCGSIGVGVDKHMCVCVIIYASIHDL